MNRRDLDIALRKQRLQLRSGELRRQIRGHLAGAAPLFDAAAAVHSGFTWLRARPLLPLAALALLLLARPRAAWRWLRRAWALWRLLRRARRWFAGPLTDVETGAR